MDPVRRQGLSIFVARGPGRNRDPESEAAAVTRGPK